MVSIVEINLASSIGELDQFPDDLLPDAAPLILQQASVASGIRSIDVVWKILPTTAGSQDVQDTVDDLALIRSSSSSVCR